MQSSSPTPHKRVQHSTTLNRKYVKRPVKTPKIRTTAEIHAENLKRRQALAARMSQNRLVRATSAQKPLKRPLADKDPIAPPKKHPLEASARAKLQKQPSPAVKPLTMREKKEQAIQSALSAMANNNQPEKNKLHKSFFSPSRIALALCIAVLSIGSLIYFVNLSIPSISVKVAAMQAGIDAVYPSYIPKGFSLSNISADETKISLKFSSPENSSYTITEEKSSWNSSTLETNYVKSLFDKNYSTIREQGLTIFISGTNCVWVNGGKLFTITSETELTKTQLVSIATSL